MPIALAPVVTLGGTTLSATWADALIDLSVERRYQVPGRVTLRFVDDGYALAEAGLAKPGTEIIVKDPSDVTLITAEITSVAVEQRMGEQPELVVVAHDKSHRLARATVAKSYSEMAYSDVVTTIAGDAGLTASVTSTITVWPYLMQADTDLGFLTDMARRVGADWWVDGTTLHFGTPAEGNQVSLTLGTDLLSFSVRASAQAPDNVQVAGWDRINQQEVTGTASSASSAILSSSTIAGYSTNGASAFGSAQLFSAGVVAGSSDEATQLSQALLDRNTAGSVRAQGVTVGNGNITLGTVIEVSQAGPLSGTYPVTRVEHIFRARSGYTTRFYSGDRVPTTLVDSLAGAALARPAFNQLGLTVGTVTNIRDPDNAGKVKVRYPGLGSQYETGWARVAAVGGGTSRGGVFLPEVNDEVLIGFECGDPRRPVVIGGLYGAKATIPTNSVDSDSGQVKSRTITSRLGHNVNLLDGIDPAQQAVELELAGGQHLLHLGKDKVTLTVPSGLAITISAGNSSLSFGTDGSVSISAPQISLTADQKISLSAPQIQAQADGQLNLQSDGTAALKGATIQVNGEGPVAIQGAIVQIN